MNLNSMSYDKFVTGLKFRSEVKHSTSLYYTFKERDMNLEENSDEANYLISLRFAAKSQKYIPIRYYIIRNDWQEHSCGVDILSSFYSILSNFYNMHCTGSVKKIKSI